MFYRILALFLLLGNSALFGMESDTAMRAKTPDAGMEQLTVYPFAQEWQTFGELRQFFPVENIHYLTEDEEWGNYKKQVRRYTPEPKFSAKQLSYLAHSPTKRFDTITFAPQSLSIGDKELIEKTFERQIRIEYHGIRVPNSRYVIVTTKNFYDPFANRGIIEQTRFADE